MHDGWQGKRTYISVNSRVFRNPIVLQNKNVPNRGFGIGGRKIFVQEWGGDPISDSLQGGASVGWFKCTEV